MPWLKQLIDILKRQRKHAGFFEWPDKPIKELGVVKRLFESMEKSGGCPYANPQSTDKDPPDCIAFDIDGNIIAVEVSEIVDQDTVRQAARGSADWKFWNEKEVLDRLERILLSKDKKHYHGQPYSKIVLVIFTDEPFLEPNDMVPTIEMHQFPKVTTINEAYLLFSYDPRVHSYPFVKLIISPNQSLKSDLQNR